MPRRLTPIHVPGDKRHLSHREVEVVGPSRCLDLGKCPRGDLLGWPSLGLSGVGADEDFLMPLWDQTQS